MFSFIVVSAADVVLWEKLTIHNSPFTINYFPPILSLICRICPGRVRQQPPINVAPALRHSRLYVPNSAGADWPNQRLFRASYVSPEFG
jgi:hypothetical protein